MDVEGARWCGGGQRGAVVAMVWPLADRQGLWCRAGQWPRLAEGEACMCKGGQVPVPGSAVSRKPHTVPLMGQGASQLNWPSRVPNLWGLVAAEASLVLLVLVRSAGGLMGRRRRCETPTATGGRRPKQRGPVAARVRLSPTEEEGTERTGGELERTSLVWAFSVWALEASVIVLGF